MTLTVRPAPECRYDAVSLGEVMLRLDPGEGRIHTTRSFAVSEGGGEYNVARGLRRTFGLRTAIVTALADNPVGRLVEDLVLQGGVDTAHIRWVPHDGIGRTVRNGLNFTERGFGLRGGLGASDRGHTAVSHLRPGEVDWEHLFGADGVRWFHTGGIFAGLSETTAAVAEEAMIAARRHGTVVSDDPNYRPSLWQGVGGRGRAQEVNRALAPLVDVLIGLDVDEHPSGQPTAHLRAAVNEVVTEHKNLSVVATPLRRVVTATVNDWGALAWSAEEGMVEATPRPGLEVLDRVGSGDSFASGLIAGLVCGRDLQTAVELGAAHGALAMTTPGDTSMATFDEVEALMRGGRASLQR